MKIVNSKSFLMLLAAAAAAVTLVGCGGAQPTPVKPTPTAVSGSGRPQSGGAVIAEGRVRPVRSADLSVAAAGVVSEVVATEGATVKKDQPILRLDSRRQQAVVAQADAALARAKAGQTRAQAVLARAQAALAQLKAGARTEDVTASRAAVQVAQAELTRVQAGADPSALISAKAAMDKAARAVQQAQFAFDHSSTGTNGPEMLRLEQATIDFTAAKGQYDDLMAMPRSTDLDVARGRLTQAQAGLAGLLAGARPETIKAAEADAAAAEADASGAAADVAGAEAALAQARAALADVELRAPFDGVVAMIALRTGEMAMPGVVAVRIGDPTGWIVETSDFTELNIVKLAVGGAATMTFDAIPGLTLNGKVTQIRPYGESKQGDIVYLVTVKPDQHEPRLRWNMTAKVSLETP